MKKYLLSILVSLTLFGCSGNKFMVAPATKDAGLEMFTRMYLPEGIETVEEAVRYVMWQQLSGQFFKRHSEFAQTPPVTYNY